MKDLEVCAPADVVNTLVDEIDGYESNVIRPGHEDKESTLVAVLFAIAVRLERIATALEAKR